MACGYNLSSTPCFIDSPREIDILGNRILVIGDCHFPWANPKTLNGIYNYIQYVSPTIIVQIGDLYDFFSFSKFPKTADVITPKEELAQGYGDAFVMWEKIRKFAPRAKLLQLKGNHDSRPLKRIIERFPEASSLLDLGHLFDFPKVQVCDSERDEVIIDKILFMHGFRARLGDHALHNGMCTVVGHSHLGGVIYHRLGDRTIWELNAGFCADEAVEPLSYTRQRRISKWTQGFGYIDNYGPRFIPLENV